ncbi:MAG: HAD family hydrolase [Pseudomonadales bacterium]
MKPIRILLLDADGVIQAPVPGWRDAVAELCGDAGKVEPFLEALFAAERPCLTGDGDFAAALEGVLATWESPTSAEEALALWTRIEPQEDLLRLVDGLRGDGIRVGLATNQQAFRAEFMTQGLGYGERFDDLFFSWRLGHAKPGAGYFQAVLEALAADGSEVLFVDDHAANVAAARESGFNAEIYDLATGVQGMHTLLARYGLAGAGA